VKAVTIEQQTPEQPAAPRSLFSYARIAALATALVLVAVSLGMAVLALGADVGPSCGGG
jgi:uncharacterized protein HemX